LSPTASDGFTDQPFDSGENHDAFVSYSRADREFVAELVAEMHRVGKRLWIDDEDIVGGVDWWARVLHGIDLCNAVVFVLSPESVASQHCLDELAYALSLNKLIVPVHHRELPGGTAPPELASREWVFVRRVPDGGLDVSKLLEAFEVDVAWRDEHTRLAARAREWMRGERDNSMLLRGAALKAAETFLGEQGSHAEQATADQVRYIITSRRTSGRRLRGFTAAVTVGLVVAVALAVFALIQRDMAVHEKQTATSRGLAALASNTAETDLDSGALLAVEAYRTSRTMQARNAILSLLPRLDRASGSFSGGGELAFSPDGSLLAVAAESGTLRMWHVEQKRFVGRPMRLPDYFGAIAFSHDGHVLAFGTKHDTTRFFDLRRRTLLSTRLKDEGYISHLQFSPDDRTIASASQDDHSVRLWDVASGRETGARLVDPSGTAAYTEGIQFSRDGSRIAIATGNGNARVWNVATHELVFSLPRQRGAVSSVAFSAREPLLASAGDDGVVRLWDASTGKPSATLRGNKGPVEAVGFVNDGDGVVSVGQDSTIERWDLGTHRSEAVPIEAPQEGRYTEVMSPDGHSVATLLPNRVRVYETVPHVALGRQLPTVGDTGAESGFSPDGRKVAVAGFDGTRVLDARTGRELAEGPRFGAMTFAVTFSSDARTVYLGADSTLGRVDATGGGATTGVVATEPLNDSVESVAVSHSTNQVAVGTGDGLVDLVDATTGRMIGKPFRVDRYAVTAVAFSPDGKRLATGDREGRFRLWDVPRRASIGPRSSPLGTQVWDVTFTPDGHLVASADDDGTARLWDATSGREFGGPMTVGRNRVTRVAFSPDGRTLATGGRDLRFWDVATQTQLGVPVAKGDAAVTALAFDASGRSVRWVTGDAVLYEANSNLWASDYESLRSVVCRQVRRNLARAVWRTLVPGEPYHRTCGNA
jgi:WD40 repeat protein